MEADVAAAPAWPIMAVAVHFLSGPARRSLAPVLPASSPRQCWVDLVQCPRLPGDIRVCIRLHFWVLCVSAKKLQNYLPSKTILRPKQAKSFALEIIP